MPYKNAELERRNKKLYYEKNKEKIKSRQAAYYKKNRHKILERNKKYDKEYKEKNKELLRDKARQYNKTHIEARKKYRVENKEILKEKAHQYYIKNKVKILTQTKEYARTHKTERKELSRKYNKTDKRKNYISAYQKKNKDKLNEKYRQWAKTEKGRETGRKKRDKRLRNFGFNPLNRYFEGANAHHKDFENIIYITEKLHKSIHHNLRTGKNMEEINKLAFDFMEKTKK